jgi:hypothetical protein
MLIGGYKFTLRLHLVVTQLHPTPTAYLHYDGQALFSTKQFTLDKKTIGPIGAPYTRGDEAPPTPGNRFDPLVHLTNQSANCKPANLKNFLADKPEVGPGCLWSMSRLEAFLDREEQRRECARKLDRSAGINPLTTASLWEQMRFICAKVTQAIAKGNRLKVETAQWEHFEIFGVDVMVDADGKLWLLEWNNVPDLGDAAWRIPGSEETNPDSLEGDAGIRRVVNDTMALLGLDAKSPALTEEAERASRQRFVKVLP